jgi:hypothetical protein
MNLFDKIKKALGFEPSQPKSFDDPDDFLYADFGGNSWMSYLNEQLQRNAEDKIKYDDYDLMDAEIPEISTAMDVIADFVVYPDNINRGQIFRVTSNKYQKQIDEISRLTKFPKMFHSIVRETIKYGDNVEEIIKNKLADRVLTLKHIPIDTAIFKMDRGLPQDDPAMVQINSAGKEVAKLNSDEILHFSLPTNRTRYVRTGKGVSLIEKSRLIYRQLRLMEEGMIINRLSKANNNYAIIVDVGDLTGEDALNYLEKYRRKIQRKKYIDPSTGRFSYKLNPLSAVEDIFVPTRQGSGGNVVPLNQNLSRGTMEDINYMQNKLIYSVGVPKILIGKEDDVNSKATTDVQFVSFLRKIRMIQNWMEEEIIRFYLIALQTQGINPTDLKVEWPIYGTIDEERKWKIELLKLQVASMLGRDMELVDDYYIYKNILLFNDDQIEELTTRMADEEEESRTEYEAAMEDAVDQSDMTTKDFEDQPDPTDKKKSKKKPDDKDEGQLVDTILELYRETLPTERYQEVEVMFKDNKCKEIIGEFIELTKLYYHR